VYAKQIYLKNTILIFQKISQQKRQFLKKLFSSFKKPYWVFFNNYLIRFLEFFFQKNILFLFKKPKKNKQRLFFLNFFKEVRTPFGLHLNKKEFIFTIYYSLLLKDSCFFLKYCRRLYELNIIKLHKKIFMLVKRFFKKSLPLFKFLKVQGVFYDLRGKIGVTGSAKKKRLYFRFFRHSLSTKDLKLDFSSDVVQTTTGVLGISTYIFF
jgi:hypothetical protein